MSKESEEKEGPGKPSEQILNLYKPKHVKNPVYWQCICYIAPTNEKKEWKFYCTDCKSITSSSTSSWKVPERHMNKKTQGFD